MNVGLSTYGRMVNKATANEVEGKAPYIRACGTKGIGLVQLHPGDKLSEGTDGATMAANRDMRRGLLEGIRKDLRSSNLDESNLLVKAFLADAAKQLNCGQGVGLDIAGQDLASATVKGLLDRLEEVKANANANEYFEDVDLEMLTDEQMSSLARALDLSDTSKLKGIEFRKTAERAYGCDVFEAVVTTEDPARRRRVRVLMQKNGLFKLESKASTTGVSAGDVDMKMLDDYQLTSLFKALGLPDKDALDGIGFTKTGELKHGCEVFEAAILKPGTTKPRYVRVLMDENRAFQLERDVEQKMKSTLPKLPTRPKKQTPSANPNVVTENSADDGLNVLQRIKKNLKSPWKPGEEPDYWKEAKGLKS